MEDHELSDAIVAYLGKGRSAFPRTDEDAARAVAVDSDPAALLQRVQHIVAECMAVTIDWSSHTLVEGGREAQQVVAENHPELTQPALDALFWMFTYSWR